MDPDFKTFAQAWVQRDKRLSELIERNPDAAQDLVTRLAEAMERRRRQVQQSQLEPDPHVVISLHPSRLHPRTGVDAEALDEIARTLEEAQRKLTE